MKEREQEIRAKDRIHSIPSHPKGYLASHETGYIVNLEGDFKSQVQFSPTLIHDITGHVLQQQHDVNGQIPACLRLLKLQNVKATAYFSPIV